MNMSHLILDLMRDALVVVRISAAWGDMDALGHVNNVVYFRYLETARVALCKELGWPLDTGAPEAGLILHSVQCRFRKALIGPDVLYVSAGVTDVQKDRFTVNHVIVSERQHANDRSTIAAEGSGIVVGFDYKRQKKAELPTIMLENLERLRGESKRGWPKCIS